MSKTTRKKNNYTDAPADIAAALDASIPFPKSVMELMLKAQSPKQLAAALKTKRVTLNLTERTLARFKTIAADEHVPYQQLIREALDEYAAAKL